MLTSADVGRRVVVRRRVAGDRPRFADTIGVLLAADATALVVRPDRGGADRTIPVPEVTAAKPVPPRARRIGVEELARIAARTWPAPETEPLGEWLLRAADGWTGRANSALIVGDPGLGLPAAVGAVAGWYAARDLRPACQVPLPAATDVDAALTDLGWQRSPTVQVRTAPITRLQHAPGGLPPVTLSRTPSDGWRDMVAARRGLPAAALAVLTGGDATFAEVRDATGATLAIGRSAVADGYLGLSCVEVAAEHRRRGLARHVMAALADAGLDTAHTAFLQVEETNSAALGLYDRLGFHTHHTYVYRWAPVTAS